MTKIKYTTAKVLIIEWKDLPDRIKKIIDEQNNFGNERYWILYSDLQKQGETLKEAFTFQNIIDRNAEDLNFEIEKFIIESEFDLEGIDYVLFHISW